MSTIFPARHSIVSIAHAYHYVMDVSSSALKAGAKPSFREMLLITIVGHVVFIYKL
jgi:hypothetical protein